MSVELYDTLSRSIQTLAPSSSDTLRFYCCGPTVYGPAHIGNFRTFLIQDTLRRVLVVDGIAVKHVRNITDLDDKTIRRSLEEGKSLIEFTAHWTEKFHADCDALNMLEPSMEPSAVAHIPQQIALVEKLIEKGNAYATDDGSVYFRVGSFEDYGRLSRLKQRELKTQTENSAGELNDADEYDRESISDFALWKSRKDGDGDNYWSSPWGEGRPGWHLECSAMVDSAFDGETIDLHGGGIDLAGEPIGGGDVVGDDRFGVTRGGLVDLADRLVEIFDDLDAHLHGQKLRGEVVVGGSAHGESENESGELHGGEKTVTLCLRKRKKI